MTTSSQHCTGDPFCAVKKKKKKPIWVKDLHSGPVAKTELPMQGARVQYLVRELDHTR